MPMRYISNEYKCDPARVMRGIAFSWLSRHIAAVVLPLAALIAASCYDLRFVYVTLIFVFIVFPMALTMVWLRHGLAPETVRLSEPQRIVADDSGLTVEYLGRGEDTPSRFAPDFFDWSEFKGVSRSSLTVRFAFSRRQRPDLVVPTEAFAPEVWEAVLSRFDDYVED